MRQTYGDTLAGLFQLTELSGLVAFRATNENQDTTIFLQTNNHRIQIVSAVVANPDKRSERLAQVEAILESVSFIRP